MNASDQMFEELSSEHLAEMDSEQAVHTLIRHAADAQASDLFFHTNEDSVDVALRRLGTVEQITVLPPDRGRQLISHVKAVAGMDISEHRRPMDGRLIYQVGQRQCELRLNVLPTLFGEDMTVRLWDRQSGLRKLDQLGMGRAEYSTLTAMLNNPSGLLLVTGPTGTGKTTTMYACLDHLSDGSRKVSTLEDPVEYALPGIRQAQVDPKVGLDFPELLRNVLRQAPDVIMIGEIRDEDTSTTAVRAANSGHLVLATLHAPTAPGAVQSMLQLGARPYFLSSSLLGIVAQRLVRRLCKHCRISYDMSGATETFAEVQSLLQKDEGNVIYGPGGCEKCYQQGYDARTGLFEIMTMSRAVRQLIAEARPTEQIHRQAVEAGMIDLKQSALLNVARGITSTEEVLRDVSPEHLGLEN